MSKHWKFYGGAAILLSVPAVAGQAQTKDTVHTPSGAIYHVNYWVSGPIIAAGAASGIWYGSRGHEKPSITDAELAAVNPNNVPSFDRSSLHQKMSLVPTWDRYANAAEYTGAAMPLLLLLDPDIRPDWLPVLTIGAEANMVELLLFTQLIGPRWIDRYRPLVYYSKADADAAGINRQDGSNKNSWYSGHVASVTAAAVFMAKVYSDYHPDANKYLLYGIAAVPSLATGVIRFMTLDHFPSDIAMGLAVGVACGVVIPELHRVHPGGVSMGFFSTPTRGTGLSLTYTPPETASR